MFVSQSDITGIKWLKLIVKEKKQQQSNGSKSNKNSRQHKTKRKPNSSLALDFDVDDDDDDDEDDDENEDEESEEETNNNEQQENKNQSTPKPQTSQQQEDSKYLHTTSMNDPILITHAKCLNEDILCSWKRVPVAPQQFQKPKKPDDGNKKFLYILRWSKN